MKVALIFGVAGQDGSYLSELLLEKGWRVFGVARRSSTNNYWRLENCLKNKNFTLLTGDVTDLSSVIACFQASQPHHVYNLAAQSHVGTSFAQPSYTTDVVYKGCLNILEATRLWETDSNKKLRVYQASSSEMFGSNYTFKIEYNDPVGILPRDTAEGKKGDVVYIDKNGEFTRKQETTTERFQNESTPFFPCSPYGVAKLAAHHLCTVYREAYSIDVRTCILFNHESPRRGDEFVTKKIVNYIGDMALRFKDNKGLEWDVEIGHKLYRKVNIQIDFSAKLQLGNVDASRDWCHAKDAVNAMYLLMNKDELPRYEYVVGTGETHTVREFLERSFDYANYNWENHVEVGTKSNLRPYDVEYLRADASLARKELGWTPTVSFTQLIEEMVDYELQKRNV